MHKVSANAVKVDCSGQSVVHIDGKATKQNVDISGQSNYDAQNLKTQTANVNVSGMSKAQLWVTKLIKGDVSGMSNIYGRGNANRSKLYKSGMSYIKWSKN
ncbi:MAG TPA: DUF2807 domain-containing protein [Candidatus Babeliales bacterium]|jgi:hypothetical protein|nr:DUF2807 domain-containing protein [Candidatus Babeliales bacterium]